MGPDQGGPPAPPPPPPPPPVDEGSHPVASNLEPEFAVPSDEKQKEGDGE